MTYEIFLHACKISQKYFEDLIFFFFAFIKALCLTLLKSINKKKNLQNNFRMPIQIKPIGPTGSCANS